MRCELRSCLVSILNPPVPIDPRTQSCSIYVSTTLKPSKPPRTAPLIMPQYYTSINDSLRDWMLAQHVFWTGTSPLVGKHVPPPPPHIPFNFRSLTPTRSTSPPKASSTPPSPSSPPIKPRTSTSPALASKPSPISTKTRASQSSSPPSPPPRASSVSSAPGG